MLFGTQIAYMFGSVEIGILTGAFIGCLIGILTGAWLAGSIGIIIAGLIEGLVGISIGALAGGLAFNNTTLNFYFLFITLSCVISFGLSYLPKLSVRKK